MTCRRLTRRRRATVLIATTIAAAALLPSAPAYALPGEGVVTDAVTSSVDKAFESVVGWVLSGVATFANGVLNFLNTSARPQPDAVWFSGANSPYAQVRSIALIMLVAFVLLAIITGVLRGDPGAMLHRVAGVLPAAIFGMVATTVVVAKLLDLVDGLSAAVLQRADGQALTFLGNFGTLAATTNNEFAALLLGFVAVLGAFLLWIELVIRSALVYFLVALSPMAFAATVWPSARGVLRRLMELLLAVIFSKLVICISLSIGAAALAAAGTTTTSSGDGVGDLAASGLGVLLSGTTLLLLGAYSPFLLLRLIPIAESAVVAQGVSRAPARAAQQAASLATSAGSITRLAGAVGGSTATGMTKSSQRLSGAASPPSTTKQSPKLKGS